MIRTPNATRLRHGATMAERLAHWTRLDEPTGCINYIGPVNHGGYGEIAVGGRNSMRVHRAAYEHFVGPIPAGMVIDHLCRNRRCCNPVHLEVVTPRENSKRADPGFRQREKTHCPRGHEYDAANTYVWTNGWRSCRACWPQRREARRRTEADRLEANAPQGDAPAKPKWVRA